MALGFGCELRPLEPIQLARSLGGLHPEGSLLSSRTREFVSWFVPDAWIGPASELGYRATRRQFLRRLALNSQLANKHKGERRCFVIGNGPSLNTQNLELLANEVTIV